MFNPRATHHSPSPKSARTAKASLQPSDLALSFLNSVIPRSPLAARAAFSNSIPTSVSPKKRKDADADEMRYPDIGRGGSLRAEGSSARDVPHRPASNTFHLPGHPRLPSFSAFSTPNLSLRRLSSNSRSSTHITPLAHDYPFSDATAGLQMQHTGEVSDSSFFRDGPEEGEYDDLLEVGEVSFELPVEPELEECGGRNAEMADEESTAECAETATSTPTPITVHLKVVGGREGKEEMANKIGAPGYVPSRIKDIETRQHMPVVLSTPLRPNKKQRFIILPDAAPDEQRKPEVESPKVVIVTAPATAPGEAGTTTPFPRLSATKPQAEYVALPLVVNRLAPATPISPTSTICLPFNPQHAPDPVIELTQRVNALLSRNSDLYAENFTLREENTTLTGERLAHWHKTRENDERIVQLELERANLKAALRSAQADNVDIEREMNDKSLVCEKLNSLIGRLGGDQGQDQERRIVETVVMMSQAGMLDAKHWSNAGGRGMLQKRKPTVDDDENESKVKRTCR